jgi:hypothetical protein
MHLTYNNELRSASISSEIANLKRKGWKETVRPAYDKITNYPPRWEDGKWVSGGLITIEPIVVTMRSFRLACGRDLVIKISAVLGSIKDENERWVAQQFFSTSPTVSESHPLVKSLTLMLEKTDTEVKEVFNRAVKLDNEVTV